MIRLLLLGTPDISVPVFETLLNDNRFEVCGFVCQPDKPLGRDRVVTPPPTKILAEKYSVPVFQPESAKDPHFIQEVKNLEPDLAFVFAYGHILRQEFLDIPKYGCVNLHGSLLPQLRGASPIQASLLHQFSESGITYIKMDVGMDTGPIIAIFGGVSLHDENSLSLQKKFSQLGSETVGDVLSSLVHTTKELVSQNHERATYCRQLSKEDGHVNPAWLPVNLCISSFRAFIEWPGVYSFWNDERIQWIDIEATDIPSTRPGNFSFDEKNLYIDCQDYKIRVLRLRKAGKNIQTSREFLQSFHQQLRDRTLLS